MEIPGEDGAHGGGVEAAPPALEHRRRRGARVPVAPREDLHEQQTHSTTQPAVDGSIDRSRLERGAGDEGSRGRTKERREKCLSLVDFSSRKGCEGKGNGPVGFFFFFFVFSVYAKSYTILFFSDYTWEVEVS